MFMFVYSQTARASPLRPIGDVTEAEVHQAADIEVMEMHQCEWEQRSAEGVLVSYWHAWQGKTLRPDLRVCPFFAFTTIIKQ